MAGQLRILIRQGASISEIASYFDELTLEDRSRELDTLGKKELIALWVAAVAPEAHAELAFLLPTSTPPHHTVEWVGKNSLPVFSRFAKRFTRASVPDELIGQNVTSLGWLIGPGYFTASARREKPSELVFDYTRYPAHGPPGWPELKRNEVGVSRLIFYQMHDYFRPIGTNLGIGAAFDADGKLRDQYFALARGEALPFGG